MNFETIAIIVAVCVFLLFLIIAISISSNAFSNFKQVYLQYKKIPNSSYLTAYQFACLVRDKKLDEKLAIITKPKEFSDAYDYSSNVLILSQNTVDDASISSLAIVSHELGHAMQNKQNTKSFKKCTKIRKFISIGCRFINPLFILGIALLFFNDDNLLYAGLGLCGLALLLFFVLLVYKVRLLRVEKEASKLGLKLLSDLQTLEDEEQKQVKQVLSAAYLTYVGDFFKALFGWTGLTNKSSKP